SDAPRGKVDAVEHRSHGPGSGRVLDRAIRIRSGRQKSSATGDEAHAAPVEEVEQRHRPAIADRCSALCTRRTEAGVDRACRSNGTGERTRPVELHPEPGAQYDVDLAETGAHVESADRQRGGRAPGSGNASVAGPGGAVVTGGRDDESVEACCARGGER